MLAFVLKEPVVGMVKKSALWNETDMGCMLMRDT